MSAVITPMFQTVLPTMQRRTSGVKTFCCPDRLTPVGMRVAEKLLEAGLLVSSLIIHVGNFTAKDTGIHTVSPSIKKGIFLPMTLTWNMISALHGIGQRVFAM